jgi:acyl dehydratase
MRVSPSRSLADGSRRRTGRAPRILPGAKDAVNQKNDNPEPLYLEDLHVGQRFTSGLYHLDKAQIKAFAAEFDPQPFHLDETAAQLGVFRGLAASGWHTAAATMRLLVTGDLRFADGSIGLGAELAWTKPVRPGDTLRVESEIVEISPSRTKPDRGVVTVRSVTLNQNGDQVQVLTAKMLVFKRTADSKLPL